MSFTLFTQFNLNKPTKLIIVKFVNSNEFQMIHCLSLCKYQISPCVGGSLKPRHINQTESTQKIYVIYHFLNTLTIR